jgi:hypothetical protein
MPDLLRKALGANQVINVWIVELLPLCLVHLSIFKFVEKEI